MSAVKFFEYLERKYGSSALLELYKKTYSRGFGYFAKSEIKHRLKYIKDTLELYTEIRQEIDREKQLIEAPVEIPQQPISQVSRDTKELKDLAQLLQGLKSETINLEEKLGGLKCNLKALPAEEYHKSPFYVNLIAYGINAIKKFRKKS